MMLHVILVLINCLVNFPSTAEWIEYNPAFSIFLVYVRSSTLEGYWYGELSLLLLYPYNFKFKLTVKLPKFKTISGGFNLHSQVIEGKLPLVIVFDCLY